MLRQEILTFSHLCHKEYSVSETMPLSFSFPMYWCSSGLCVISFTTFHSQQINVTTTAMSFTVKSTFSGCKYGGLVAIEKLNDKYLESNTLCTNHNGSENHNRSFYSHNSSLTLIMYQFFRYSKIEAVISVTKTECVTVPIN